MYSLPAEIMTPLLIISGIAGTVWGFAWWLSNKFNELTTAFYTKIDKVGTMILEKLEYHERHDDSRFSSVSDDLWEIRLRNAKVDGEELNKQNK